MKQQRDMSGFVVAALAVGFCCGVYVGQNMNTPSLAVKAAVSPVEIRSITDLPKPKQSRRSLGVWNVSAYCTCSKCCDQFADGITASGKPAKGLIVAAPPSIPFGTRLDVPGYGVASVEDRGGAIKGRKLDLLFPTHQAALNWGRKHIEVFQITK